MRKEIKLVKRESGLISINLCFKVQQGDTDPGGSDGKTSAYNAGDLGSIPGSGRSPGEGNGNPLQCSCLENPMDGGSWSWGHKESDTTERLHFHFQGDTERSLVLRSLGVGKDAPFFPSIGLF